MSRVARGGEGSAVVLQFTGKPYTMERKREESTIRVRRYNTRV